MKKVTDIQEIAEKVLKGSLSRQDGAWLVIEFIYTNKKLFRLNYITEDEVHDLILNSYEKFIEIFDKYKIQEGPFINYIYKVTAGLITLWRRSKAKKNINRKSLYFIASSEYDEKFDKYQEKSFSCACPDSDENTQEELSRYKKISKQLSSKKLYGKTGVRKRDAEILGKKYEKLRREAGIILALKS